MLSICPNHLIQLDLIILVISYLKYLFCPNVKPTYTERQRVFKNIWKIFGDGLLRRVSAVRVAAVTAAAVAAVVVMSATAVEEIE
jgi:hypothetical protein